MKKMLNRALSVLFAILTIVSLCTSPIMAEEVETTSSCQHNSGEILSIKWVYEDISATQHKKYRQLTCRCKTCGGLYIEVNQNEISEENHLYTGVADTEKPCAGWIYTGNESHFGKKHSYEYKIVCVCCNHEKYAICFVSCPGACLPYPPF